MAWDLGDYKEVSERLDDLFAKHPEASMRGSYEFVTIGDQTGVAYRAECFRFPDDPAPGVGSAWEDMPGKSSYTKGSELQNAETSAWGRAIVAAGASTSKKVASANEVRSARARQKSHEGSANAGSSSRLSPPHDDGPAISQSELASLKSRAIAINDDARVDKMRVEWNLPKLRDCNAKQLSLYGEMLRDIEADLERPFVEVPS